MKTSIILTTTEAATDKKRKRSFSDINPNATNEELKNFARAINALTTNSYVETNRVDTTNVDNEESRKSFRNTQITDATAGSTATITMKISENETITPVAVYAYGSETITANYITPTAQTSTDPTKGIWTLTIPNQGGGVLFVGITEKTNFYADFTKTNVS